MPPTQTCSLLVFPKHAVFWNQCLEGWGGRVNRWIYDPETELSRKVGWNSQEGWTASHGQVNAKDSGVLLGKVLPPLPATSCVGRARAPAGALLMGEEQQATRPPRETPSVPRHSQHLQKRSSVQGQPLCVSTGPRFCRAGCGAQDRWPLRLVPLRSPTPFQKCSRSVT